MTKTLGAIAPPATRSPCACIAFSLFPFLHAEALLRSLPPLPIEVELTLPLVVKLQLGKLSAQVLCRRANAITDYFLNLLLYVLSCPPRALLCNNPS